MNRIKLFVIMLSLLPLSNCVMANTNDHPYDGVNDPILVGSVSDAFSKKPLKGVTIFVTSLKSRVEKSFITDENGHFTIPKSILGEVTIVLEKKGYRTYRRENVFLREGQQVKLSFDISNEEPEESNVFHPLQRMMDY